jgi:hypothetical protein
LASEAISDCYLKQRFARQQVYLFDLHEGVIEEERKRLGQHGLQLDELRRRKIPKSTPYRRRLVETAPAAEYALLGLFGADPGWLGPGPAARSS